MIPHQRKTPRYWGELAKRGLLERPPEITHTAENLGGAIGKILRFLYDVEEKADEGRLAMFPTTRQHIERARNELQHLAIRLNRDSVKQYNGPITA